MMTNKAKKIVSILGVCLLLSACGSDNKGAPAAPAVDVTAKPTEVSSAGAPVTSSTVPTAETFDQLKQQVSAGNFATLPNVSNYNYISYNFLNCSNNTSKFLGIFSVNTNSCTGNFSRVISKGVIIREDGFSSRQAIIDNLMGMLNSITPGPTTVNKVNSSVWQFVHNNSIYTINLAQPLEAQPVFKSNMTSGDYYNYYYVNYANY